MNRRAILIDLPVAVVRALNAEARRRSDSPGRVVEDALRPFLAGLRAARGDTERAGREAAEPRSSS
jgi:hypothetical protein